MSFLGKGGGGGSVWRQINAWRRGQTVGWETNRARAVFRRRCHAPMATLECFGSFRLIVSHKLSSAVFKQDGQDRGFHWRGYTWAQQRTCLIYLREAALKFRLGEKKKFGGIVRDENELLCRIRWLAVWHPTPKSNWTHDIRWDPRGSLASNARQAHYHTKESG